LSDFTPVSIKMAKEQNLSLNPTKISGLCDRLMCCLKYEQDHYEQTRKRMPRVGREIITPDGSGVINAINVLEETVRVRIAVGDSFELREYKIDDCQRPGQDERKPRPEEDATAEVAQQAAENAEGGAAETAEPNPLKKQEQRPPRGRRGARAETGARPQAGTRPAAGAGGAPAEAGERPETAEKAGGQAAGQGSAREGRTAGRRGAEGRRGDRRAGNPRGREEGRPFLKNDMRTMTALAVKMSKKPFVHGFISKNWEFKIALYLNLNR
ncbi:MAG: regulatory iron-sulfur-containing complex subunit RicT, partial [Christensenellales bacterium]